MQQLDDVTGETIRLSAQQREQRMQQTISTLNSVILQSNALTAEIRKLQGLCFEAERRLQALESRLIAIETAPSLWTRLTRR